MIINTVVMAPREMIVNLVVTQSVKREMIVNSEK